MNPTVWIKFRSQLFALIEERRAKLIAFRLEQFYLLILNCSKLFSTPRTKGAQAALSAIRDDGTFLLVADSLSAFLAMFPAVVVQQDAKQPPAAQPEPEPTNQGADPGQQSEAVAISQVAAPKPEVHRPSAHQTDTVLSRRYQPTDARRGSGQPFRR
jgi:hypothetical protein